MSFALGVAEMRRNDVDRQLFASLPYAACHHDRHSRHSQQVVRSHGELEVLIDSLQAAKHGLSDPAHGLGPAERLLNPFADSLAQPVTRMACGSRVDGTAPATSVVARHVRGDVALTATGDEVAGVIGFVGTETAATADAGGARRASPAPRDVRRCCRRG